MSNNKELATFGGGCFWCLEAIYLDVIGVTKVTSGYAGGATPDPSYEQVCRGRTGHAEVVQIEYDPAIISYDDLLTIFWRIHDPTTLNRQGADVGTQYRSIILTHDATQKVAAYWEKIQSNEHAARVLDEMHRGLQARLDGTERKQIEAAIAKQKAQ